MSVFSPKPVRPIVPVTQEVKVNDIPAPACRSKSNPVVDIFAMNDYVVFVRKDGTRSPVQRAEALRRMEVIVQGFYVESSDKPKDEIEYEHWLTEHVIKAAAKSAELMGRPYRSKDVDAKLRQMDIAVKRIKDNPGDAT